MDVYKAILNKKPVVYLPDMPTGKVLFWDKLASKLGAGVTFEIKPSLLGTLGEYSFKKDILQWKSLGLESEVIARMFPFVDKLEFKQTQAEWTNPIEPLLCMLGADYGYKNIIIGSERVYGNSWEDEYGKETFFYPCTMEFVKDWHDYSGCNLMLPLILMDKLEILKVAIDMNVTFYSCDEYSYCGQCPKCTEVFLLYKVLKRKAPFTIKKVMINDTVKKLIHTYKLDVDGELC